MGNCSSVTPEAINIKDRTGHLQKTPFFLYLDEAQLTALAECFTSHRSLKVGQEVELSTNTIYIMCKGKLEMTTVLPSHSAKSGQNRGYLCKKVEGDIVNKNAAHNDAKRKVSFWLFCDVDTSMRD